MVGLTTSRVIDRQGGRRYPLSYFECALAGITVS